MTDKYDPTNPVHNKIKKDIEIGDGLPNLDTTKEVIDSLQKAGFEIIEYKDLSPTDSINPIPWFFFFLNLFDNKIKIKIGINHFLQIFHYQDFD